MDGRRAGLAYREPLSRRRPPAGKAVPDGGDRRRRGTDRRRGRALGVLVVQTQAKADIARRSPRNAGQPRRPAPMRSLGRSRAAVQARYELAVDAIKTFHTGVSEDFLLKEESSRPSGTGY